ncbi:predicted protein [Histoplasma capsulatum var. duboisii H88]|uniref:Predicted protein n=2 Tax=Ajellomyces capsulatus TaxID=5037 RepID=F0UPU3_AJEC8|nr:predicted protein [Histoplasma capsulatum H143]EGC47838.1 predicted protein [Histoplasma capsulatum var. duboisii H88]
MAMRRETCSPSVNEPSHILNIAVDPDAEFQRRQGTSGITALRQVAPLNIHPEHHSHVVKKALTTLNVLEKPDSENNPDARSPGELMQGSAQEIHVENENAYNL